MNKVLPTLAIAVLISTLTIPVQQSFAIGHTYNLCGPTLVAQNDGIWNWVQGTALAEWRAAITDPNHFGPAGTVPTTVNIVGLDDPTLANINLAGCDGFMASFWADAAAAPYAAGIATFFANGGDIITWQDASGFDRIGQELGVPTVGSIIGDPILVAPPGGSPLFDGPFGIPPANSVTNAGSIGEINAIDVTSQSGDIAAISLNQGLVAAGVWAEQQYAFGSGSLVVVNDIDIISSAFKVIDYGPPPDGPATFGLNALAFFITQQPVGGEMLSLDTTALLVAGVTTPVAWMAYAFSAIGIGAFLFARNPYNVRNAKAILEDYFERFNKTK